MGWGGEVRELEREPRPEGGGKGGQSTPPACPPTLLFSPRPTRDRLPSLHFHFLLGSLTQGLTSPLNTFISPSSASMRWEPEEAGRALAQPASPSSRGSSDCSFQPTVLLFATPPSPASPLGSPPFQALPGKPFPSQRLTCTPFPLPPVGTRVMP